MEKPIPQQSAASPKPSSPANSLLTISEVLKRTDQFIRKGELVRAQGELAQAKILAPKNTYVLALEERVASLISEANRRLQEQNQKNILPANGTNIPIPQPSQFTTLPLQPMDAMMNAISGQRLTSRTGEASANPVFLGTKKAEFDRYRDALIQSWQDGAPDPAKSRQLRDLQIILEIPDSEHALMEKEIKQICCKNAAARYAQNGKSFLELRRAFRLSDAEGSQVQVPLRPQHPSTPHHSVMVVDDDPQFLTMLTESIGYNGYTVIPVSTSDEAYRRMEQQPPDLILSDINLISSTMNGFIFREKIQQHQTLRNIPFIFLTGFDDQRFVRIGNELGAAGYLLKSIPRQVMLNTIKENLERSQRMSCV